MTTTAPETASFPVATSHPVQLVAGGLTLTLDLSNGAHVVSAESAARPGLNLIDRWWCGYTADDQTWSDAPLPSENPFAGATVSHTPQEVTARAAAPHLNVEKRFTLYPGLPFIRVRYHTETTNLEGRGPGMSLGLPAIHFSSALVDPFDLDEDTADNGQELEGGLELPAWRIFADPTGAFGLVVFAARRRTMSRLQVTERGCAFRPAYYQAYSSEVVTTHFLNFSLQYSNFGPVDEIDWFLGAYDRETWPAMRRTISAFHARRLPASGGEILQVSPDLVATSGLTLPVTDALPAAWPARLRLAPGASGQTLTRRFAVLPSSASNGAAAAPAAAPTTGVSSASPSLNGLTLEAQPAGTIMTAADPAPAYDIQVTAPAGTPAGHYHLEAPLGASTLPLDVDVVTSAPLPAAEAGGRVAGAAEIAAGGISGWQLIQHPGAPGGASLMARASSGAAPFRFEHGLRGPYDVYAGVAGGIGLKVQLDGDPYWTYLTTRSVQSVQTWQAIDTLCQSDTEVLIRRAHLDGGGLSIAPHPNINGATILTHLRFVPSPEPEPVKIPVVPNRKRFFAGLSDIPVVGHELADEAAIEETWRGLIWAHAAHGIDTIYWRIDGQCSDFHTKIGTVRYSTPRVHNLYTPAARYYGLALRAVDPLKIAVDESKRWGLHLFGWMRTNNYSGNVVSQFFVDHPEWHDVRENGRKSPSLCLAFPEVRAHKISILVEAAAYGLNGLMVDTLRHPPLVHYHPIMIDAFRAEYGEDPPREPETQMDWGMVDNRVGERWERWFRFRARYVTQMFRELRDALRAAGMGNLPVHIRVAPSRFLHDGADLESLLSEGLVDAVVANRYHKDTLDYEKLFPVVRGRVPICAICDNVRPDPVTFLEDLQRDSRLTGVGMYESEWSVHQPEHRAVLLKVAHRLRAEASQQQTPTGN